jgi:hypothetical protein
MKFFKDVKDETWEITINVAAIKKVRDLINADLLDVNGTLPRLLADPIFLVDVLYCLCKQQADAKNISDEQFGEGMAGDCLGFAKNTLVEELKSFFPSLEERNAVDRLIKKGNEMIGLLRKKSLLKLEATDMDAKAEEILKLFGETSMSSPESPESILQTSPSVN